MQCAFKGCLGGLIWLGTFAHASIQQHLLCPDPRHSRPPLQLGPMPRCGNQRASRPQAGLGPSYAPGCGAPAQASRLLHPPLPQPLDDQSDTLSHTFHAAAGGAAGKQGATLAAVMGLGRRRGCPAMAEWRSGGATSTPPRSCRPVRTRLAASVTGIAAAAWRVGTNLFRIFLQNKQKRFNIFI